MQQLEELKQKALKMKDQFTKTPLERALSEATSNENWNAPVRISQEIADATYSYADCGVIMKYIWKRLNSDTKEWRRVLKSLTLIEYLIKNGAPRCIGDFKEEMFKIRTFSDFYLVDNGSDRGAAIREKTKQVLDLLTNEKLIEEERENAKKIKDRLQQFGGSQSMGSDKSYQGYSSNQYNQNNSISSNSNRNVENDYSKKYGLEQDLNDQWKSSLDKYRGKKEDQNNTPVEQSPAPLKEQPTQEYKKPFQEPLQKLSKPGEEWTVPSNKPPQATQWSVPQPQTQTVQQTPPKQQQVLVDSLIDFDDAPIQTNVQQQTQTNSDWTQFTSIPITSNPPLTQQINFNQFQPFQQPQIQSQVQVTPQLIQQVQTPQIGNLSAIPQNTFPQIQQQQQPNLLLQQPMNLQQQQNLINLQSPLNTQQQYQQQPQGFNQINNYGLFQQPGFQPQGFQTQPQVQGYNFGLQQPLVQTQPKPVSNYSKDGFQDFQSSTNKGKDVKNLEADFMNLSDLSLGPQKKQQSLNLESQAPTNIQQAQLFTTQSELDSFSLGYKLPQQPAQFAQGQNQAYKSAQPYGQFQQGYSVQQQQFIGYNQQQISGQNYMMR